MYSGRGETLLNICAIKNDLDDRYFEHSIIHTEYLSSSVSSYFPFRTDLPRYCVFSKGRLVEDTFDLLGFGWEDFVSFYIGCSFSFERALLEAGLELRNLTEKKDVSIHKSNIGLFPVGPFDCSMAVSMRPFTQDVLPRVVEITAQFPYAHGAPIHIGDPARIGVSLTDLVLETVMETVKVAQVPMTMKEDEVPVFWGCGVTGRFAITSSSKNWSLCDV